MHPSVQTWVAEQIARHDLAGRRTIEIGSRDVNGGVRELFTGPYLGIDRVWGPGVDAVFNVENTAELPLPGTWELVVSTEALEHTLRPELALRNMARLATTNGMLLLTCRGYDQRGCWEVHDAPDYWRFSDIALIELLRESWHRVTVEPDPDGPGWLCWAAGRLSGAVWADTATVES